MANPKYDWLQSYENARVGSYGDSSDPLSVVNRIKNTIGSDFDEAKKAGIIREDGSVDWEKAPALKGWNSAGGNAPKGFSYQPVGGRFGQVRSDGSPIAAGYGGSSLYSDPNYGTQYMVQNRPPEDWQMKLGKALAFSAFAGPAAATFAPMIGGSLGLGSGWNSTIGALLKSAPGLIQSGGQNWMSTLGKILGGATGIPGGSTIGGIAGSYAQMTPEQRAALNKMVGG